MIFQIVFSIRGLDFQDMTIQIDPNVTGYLKLPDLLDMMSRIILERNYDAQIEDAFRWVFKTWIAVNEDVHIKFSQLIKIRFLLRSNA